jgi:hypothetical protein
MRDGSCSVLGVTVRVLCLACLGVSCQACLPVSIAFACLFMGHCVSVLRSGLVCAVQDIEDRIENLVATGVLQKGLSAGASLANDATFCVWLAPDPSDDGGVEESKSFAGEGESETKSGEPVTDAEAMPPIKSPSLMRQYSVDDVRDTHWPPCCCCCCCCPVDVRSLPQRPLRLLFAHLCLGLSAGGVSCDVPALPPTPSLSSPCACDPVQNIRTSVLHPESSVQVLTGDLLVDRLLTKSQSISEVLGITVSEAEILGAAYDWDVTAVVSNYVRDSAKTRGDAGLSVIPSRAPAVTLPGTVSCIVCTDEVDGSAAFALWCGHTFCNDCWGQHVRSQVGYPLTALIHPSRAPSSTCPLPPPSFCHPLGENRTPIGSQPHGYV